MAKTPEQQALFNAYVAAAEPVLGELIDCTDQLYKTALVLDRLQMRTALRAVGKPWPADEGKDLSERWQRLQGYLARHREAGVIDVEILAQVVRLAATLTSACLRDHERFLQFQAAQ